LIYGQTETRARRRKTQKNAASEGFQAKQAQAQAKGGRPAIQG
jgi:hypothetical protein